MADSIISGADAGVIRERAVEFAIHIAEEGDTDDTYTVDAILKMADSIYKFLYDGELPQS